jgi:hypothetical protein
MLRRYHDGRSLDFAMRGKQLLDGAKTAAAEFAGDGIGFGQVRVHHTDQPYGSALLRQLVIDTGVAAAKDPNPNHGCVNGTLSFQWPLWEARF